MEKSVKKYWPFFLIPTVGAFVIGFIIPFIEGVYLSFCKFNTIKDAEWVGFKNFIYIFTKEKTGFAAPGGFLDAFLFTGKFTIVSVILINVLAFALALALTKGIKGTNIFRTIFFMPNLIGGVVLGYVWKTLINCFLSIIGQPLLALNSTAGYWGLIILMCWQQIGYMMIVYIAGLKSVPYSVIEAAEIDGASRWQKITHVTLPSLKSTIIILILMSLSGIFRSDFGLFYQVTQNSGPLIKVTQTIDTYVYRGLMQTNNIGMSSAAGVYQSVVGFILVMTANGIVRKVEKDSALF